MKNQVQPSRRLSSDDAVEVWLLRWDGWLQSRIAARFDTNQGRISDILNEKTHPGSREKAVQRLKASA